MLAHSRHILGEGVNKASRQGIVGFSDVESLDDVDQFIAAYEVSGMPEGKLR